MESERRNDGSKLAFDQDSGVLVVGSRVAVLDDTAADVVVTTYVDLVVAQRAVAPTGRNDLRDRELEQLAALLDLPPTELDALIDLELDRLLGRDVAPAVREAHKRRWLVAAGAAVAAAAAAVAMTAASADSGVQTGPARTSAGTGAPGERQGVVINDAVEGSTPVAPSVDVAPAHAAPVQVAPLPAPLVVDVPAPIADPVPPPIGEPVGTPESVTFPDGSTGTVTESPAAPATEDLDIDSAVVYER